MAALEVVAIVILKSMLAQPITKMAVLNYMATVILKIHVSTANNKNGCARLYGYSYFKKPCKHSQ